MLQRWSDGAASALSVASIAAVRIENSLPLGDGGIRRSWTGEGRGMDKSNDAVAAARKYLVERRSALIKSLGFAQQKELMEAHVDMLVRL